MQNELQRPEGALIAAALKRSGISARRAAEKAGMSDARWRQIVNGYQSVGAGQTALVIGPAETIARMARVVGVPPADLRAAGREDAADELENVSTPSDSAVSETEIRYRKPEGMSDQQWRSIRARSEAYLQGLLDQAAEER